MRRVPCLTAALVLAVWSAASCAGESDHWMHLLAPGEGWTAFKPSTDSRLIYVSASGGNDAHDGQSPQRPLQTLAKSFELLRPGYPDWLLLKRGDVWEELLGSIFNGRMKGGRGRGEPMLIASYGREGDRPLLKVGETNAALRVACTQPVRHLAIVGLHFTDHKGDPARPGFDPNRIKTASGISWLAPGEDVLLEDCRFEYLGNMFVGKPSSGGTNEEQPQFLKDLRIRRCAITHAWSSSGHCQGLFADSVDGLLLEENLLDHNGWLLEAGDEPTIFNHNAYITIRCDKVVARGNIVTRGSSTGLYCRTNGVLEGNLCWDNCPALNLGRINQFRPGGVTGRVAGNVVLGGSTRKTQKRAIPNGGIEVGNVNRQGVIVEDNIVANHHGGDAALALSPAGVGFHNVVLRNNIVYNWTRSINYVGTYGEELEKQKFSNVHVCGNLFQIHDARGAGAIIRSRDTTDAQGFAYESNVYWHADTNLACVELQQPLMLTLDQWLALSKEKPSQVRKVTFADPARDLGSYHRRLGGDGMAEAFLVEAAKQGKSHWRKEYTAAAVIAYIREGFRILDDAKAKPSPEP